MRMGSVSCLMLCSCTFCLQFQPKMSATSVLSKRWRSLWKMVPKLKFEFNDEVSPEDVYKLLILHKAPVLESLHLDIEDTKGRLDLGILFGIAFSRHVRELMMHIYNEDQNTIRFPSIMCSYNNTLEVLKLTQHVLLDFPFRVCFNALRELHLYHVVFENENILASLTSAKRLSFLPSYLPLEVKVNTVSVSAILANIVLYQQIKFPTGSIFYQLVSLELRIKDMNGWNLLSFMLDRQLKQVATYMIHPQER